MVREGGERYHDGTAAAAVVVVVVVVVVVGRGGRL